MIITKLIGGLGNQMFQYAAGRRTAYANNTELKLDITGFDHQVGITPRVYALGIFNIHASIASKQEIELFNINSTSVVHRHWHRIKLSLLRRHYIQQKTPSFTHEFLTIPDNSYLYGHWGSEKYFKDIENIIRKELTFKDQPDRKNIHSLRKISNCNSVSIHIRRGDYVHDKKTSKFHGVCSPEYYTRAVSLISKKISNPHIFVFSDDPQWTKQNVKLKHPITVIDHNFQKKDHEDLRLMSSCKHHIIANSSFSWWGAWLNKRKGKIVITPKRWFKNSSIDTKDLIPKDWIRI